MPPESENIEINPLRVTHDGLVALDAVRTRRAVTTGPPSRTPGPSTPDDWYASGDIVRRRPDGNLVVEGRDKDMINRGGEKISAEEVENLLYRLPGIAQVAAVAMPDAELGERVCVFAVTRPGTDLTLAGIRSHLAAAGVARFKWPERLEIVPELPVTKVGKLDKKALREILAAAGPAGPAGTGS